MRIAMISYWSCPFTRLGVLTSGGMNVYVLNLANSLGKAGNLVDIFTRAHKENDESVLAVNQNVRIIHLSTSKIDHYKNVKLFSVKILKFIQRNFLSYDIVHSHYFYSGIVGLSLKTKLSVPLIHTFHTLGFMKSIVSKITDKARIKTESNTVRRASGIVASTELEVRDLISGYNADKQKIFTVSPGVNHQLFKPRGSIYSRRKLNLPRGKKIVLFVGRIDPIKGISFLIEAIASLTRKYPFFSNKYRVLLIGGDIQSQYFWQNPEVKKIKSLLIQKNLECCVKFIGSVSHNLLSYYYSAADVVVMPSVYESFGLVVLEAMACGSCVLASSIGGLKYLIQDKANGRLFPSGNADRLCEILWELVNDKEQRKRLGRQAFIASQNFCWDKQAEKTLLVYQKFICAGQ